MMNPENAMVSRRAASISRDEVVLLEQWDLTHPDCPFIRNPWSEYTGPLPSPMMRRVVMTQKEYAKVNPALK